MFLDLPLSKSETVGVSKDLAAFNLYKATAR